MKFEVSTQGHTDIVDITSQVEEAVKKSGIKNGLVNVLVLGSTAGITTIEYEPGLKKDIKEMLEKIAPENYDYHHHSQWGDFNGSAHLRSSLIGTSLTVAIENSGLLLGTWQQIILADFDDRPRERTIVVTVTEGV